MIAAAYPDKATGRGNLFLTGAYAENGAAPVPTQDLQEFADAELEHRRNMAVKG